MNKGLEVIEAKWLFHLKPEQIDVIIHPQSIIHSIVQFEDGSMKSQMGLPDMKLPIQYALGYPNRIRSDFKRFDFLDYPSLSFQPADVKTFRNLALAFIALDKGGNMPCILNAANEIAVESFLIGQIGFMEIPELIEVCMNEIDFIEKPGYEDYVATDVASRNFASAWIKKLVKAR
jgi:1-deoxy-D-xylulose-5-phosphate reductoisomerase